MIECPICKNKADKENLKKFESECIFLKFENINQHLIRYQCSICDVIFGPEDMLNLTKDQIIKCYHDVYNSGYRESDSIDFEKFLFSLLNPKKDGIYINWGSGTSSTLESLKNEGYNIYNYDPGIPENEYSLDKIITLKVDGIISNNVIDHLQNPIEDLLLMKKILKENGVMIHASDGFNYINHFTKFHLFFFVGDSVKFISEKINMNYEFIPSPQLGSDILKFTFKE